ncbi:hypothetical protein LDG_7129 [Legionella drancourtii LLAP12]|uniref:Uncharacterized protein n=1 Tax=Legionella drancourtii LLAP12 TaxID=658187 RepID=G9EPE5_9GAMM|nr:hypothetical protein LDG_7129 [Legionella drancourtii LLAP12]
MAPHGRCGGKPIQDIIQQIPAVYTAALGITVNGKHQYKECN